MSRLLLRMRSSGQVVSDLVTSLSHTNHDNSTHHSSNGGADIFGGAGDLKPLHLFIAFLVVAFCLPIIGEILNALEEVTEGTAYNLMLQRIYRELMMVGFSSFFWTISFHANIPISSPLSRAFQFAEVTLFIMACFFCVQGGLFMIASMRQGRAWERASKVPCVELQLDAERESKSRPFAWNHLYFPFCFTRDQVEFRIFHSIFVNSYNISPQNYQFDFGMFLRQTHETNMLTIIDISAAKWAVILVIIGVAAVKVTFIPTSSCDTNEDCAETAVITFFILGVAVMSFAAILVLVGRSSELKLLRITGTETANDYLVFLMLETYMREHIEKTKVVDAEFLRKTLQDLQSEAESSELKLDPHTKLRKRSLVKVLSSKSNKMSSKIAPMLSRGASGRLSGKMKSMRNLSSKSPVLSTKKQHISQSDSETTEEKQTSSQKNVNASTVNEVTDFVHPPNAEHDMEAANRSTSLHQNSAFTFNDNIEDEADDEVADIPLEISSRRKYMPSGPHGELPVAGEGFFVETRIVPPPQERQTSMMKLQKSVRGLVKGASSKFRTPPARLTSDLKRQKFRAHIRSNFKNGVGSQNYPGVFLFGSPKLFYFLIDCVMTCNSLYIAIFFTNYLLVASEAGPLGPLFAVAAIVPAIITVLLLAMVLKTSSLLQAVTKLNVDVVASVIDATAANFEIVQAFRPLFIQRMGDETGLTNEDGLAELFSIFNLTEEGFTKNQFYDMISEMQLHYSTLRWKTLFGAINIDNNATVSFDEMRKFLFPEAAKEDEKIRKRFFDAKNKRMLGQNGNFEAAARILLFLDPECDINVFIQAEQTLSKRG